MNDNSLLRKATGHSKQYSRFIPKFRIPKQCEHVWIDVQAPPAALSDGWIKHKFLTGKRGPIIFKSEADFYHTAFFTAAIGKRGSYQFTKELSNGILSALNAEDACYKELLTKQKSFILDTSLPVEMGKDIDACNSLEQLLKKHGHL